MRATYPQLFYKQTRWFKDERFMQRPCPPLPGMPQAFIPVTDVPDGLVGRDLPWAVELTALYLESPSHPIWRDRYWWTADVDRFGQRVFIGLEPNGAWAIHRHLMLTKRWGVAVW